MSPIGPRPEDDDGSSLRNGGVLDGLPRRRKHVGEVDEAVVSRPFGHLDMRGLSVRDAEVFGLASRDLAVELREPKERGAGPVLFDLRRLALTEELLVTHEAVTTRHLERDDDPVAGLDGRDVLPDLLDDPHRFVAEYVAGPHEGRQRLVEVKV